MDYTANVNEKSRNRFVFCKSTKILTSYTTCKHSGGDKQRWLRPGSFGRKEEEIDLNKVVLLKKKGKNTFLLIMKSDKYIISDGDAAQLADFIRGQLPEIKIDLVSFRPPSGIAIETITGKTQRRLAERLQGF